MISSNKRTIYQVGEVFDKCLPISLIVNENTSKMALDETVELESKSKLTCVFPPE